MVTIDHSELTARSMVLKPTRRVVTPLAYAKTAQCENLSIEGVVTDLTNYCAHGKFDVVVHDRLVRMFKDTKDKVTQLSKAAQATAESGYALLADTPSNQEHIERQFGERKAWMQIAAGKGRWIFKRVTGAT